MFSYLIDFEAKRYELWERCVLPFNYDPKQPFFNILVPTVDTTRFGYLMDKFLDVNQSVLFTGMLLASFNCLISLLFYVLIVSCRIYFKSNDFKILIILPVENEFSQFGFLVKRKYTSCVIFI